MTTTAVTWLLYNASVPTWVWVGYLVLMSIYHTLRTLKFLEEK